MKFTDAELDKMLDDLEPRMEEDEGIVSIGFEDGADGDTVLMVRHLEPASFQQELLSESAKRFGVRIEVEEADPIRLELARPDEPSYLDSVHDASSIIGMSGTKIGYSGGGWGTLCLSGDTIKATFGEKACEVEGPFVSTNSHVADAVGKQLSNTNRRVYGRVNCLFDLDAPRAFDFATAKWTSNVKDSNFFTVFDVRGAHKKIAELQVAERGDRIGKQGAKTGWTSGQVGTKVRIRVEGNSAIYPAWRGTYRSAPGDSGSPVLKQSGGKWYLVGIHFASGPHFQSWDDAEVKTKSPHS